MTRHSLAFPCGPTGCTPYSSIIEPEPGQLVLTAQYRAGRPVERGEAIVKCGACTWLHAIRAVEADAKTVDGVYWPSGAPASAGLPEHRSTVATRTSKASKTAAPKPVRRTTKRGVQ